MQHNFQHKNKSHLIKATQDAKRKSRHRLMGSIFLLLVALVVLLNVTSKIKQVNVTPDKVEIKNTQVVKATEHPSTSATTSDNQALVSSQVISNNNSISNKVVDNSQNNNVQKNNSSADTSQHNNIVNSPQTINNNNTQEQPQTDNGYKASVISKNNEIDNKNTTNKNVSIDHDTIKNTENISPNKANNNPPKFSPRVISEKSQAPSPEDILNGVAHTQSPTKFFIQLTASNNKTKLQQIQQTLNHKNIHTFIEPVQMANGSTIYRLRMGPFNSKDEANQNLAKVSNN